jgi:hypothetical protein
VIKSGFEGRVGIKYIIGTANQAISQSGPNVEKFGFSLSHMALQLRSVP